MTHNTPTVLFPTLVENLSVLKTTSASDMNSSHQGYENSDMTATPSKDTTGTPNTSQSSLSPASTVGGEEIDSSTALCVSNRFISNSATGGYSTPSFLREKRKQPLLNADDGHHHVQTTDRATDTFLEAKTTECFPLDLDLVRALQKNHHHHHTKSTTTTTTTNATATIRNESGDGYTIDELQTISRDARGHLMELTVSREGRELQRWEHLGITAATATSTMGGSHVSASSHSTELSHCQQQQQQIYNGGYPNCRLTTGCIPILPGGKIILISSSKSQDIFVLPKGGWEHDESLPLSALRETLEEAGVTGLLGPPLPSLTYETKKSLSRRLSLGETTNGSRSFSSNNSATSADGSERTIAPSDSSVSAYHTHNRLTIFPMYVQCIYDHWPEDNRVRRIVSIDEALVLLQHRQEFLSMVLTLQKQNLHQIGGE